VTSFLSEAIERHEAAWKKELEHPFVQGISDGTLSEDRFRVYLRQDYLFLIGYCRVMAAAAWQAEDLETMGRFAELLQATLTTEMELHRSTCVSYGIEAKELARTEPLPACTAYVDHLLVAAGEGSLAILCAALLPCAVGYARIGRALADRSPQPTVPAYRDWIKTYSSSEFQEYADWLAGLTDELASGADRETRERMVTCFEQSVQHEIAFWDMAWGSGTA
jgi:thiaminase/transcriptional activator TenA